MEDGGEGYATGAFDRYDVDKDLVIENVDIIDHKEYFPRYGFKVTLKDKNGRKYVGGVASTEEYAYWSALRMYKEYISKK